MSAFGITDSLGRLAIVGYWVESAHPTKCVASLKWFRLPFKTD